MVELHPTVSDGVFLNFRTFHEKNAPYWCFSLSNLAFGRREKNIWLTFASGGRKKLWGAPKSTQPFFRDTKFKGQLKFLRGATHRYVSPLVTEQLYNGWGQAGHKWGKLCHNFSLNPKTCYDCLLYDIISWVDLHSNSCNHYIAKTYTEPL